MPKKINPRRSPLLKKQVYLKNKKKKTNQFNPNLYNLELQRQLHLHPLADLEPQVLKKEPQPLPQNLLLLLLL
jgi:hypothetical protein